MKHLKFLAPLCVLAATAHAHITLETRSAEAGSYYKAVFKVGHGCEGSAIRQIIVNIPGGVQGAKPMPKAGWQIDIEKAKLAQPYTSHGKTVSEDVSRITWSGGPLPDAYYDEFVLMARLPDAPGQLAWKVSQICEKGRIDWVELPTPGGKSAAPAPLLELRPKDGAAHQH